MKRTGKVLLFLMAFTVAVLPLLSQTSPAKKPSFEVVSIKPNVTPLGGPIRIGGGARGDRYTMTATLRLLVQQAYTQTTASGPMFGSTLQIIGGPSWMDSDRYDIQATADCSGGVLTREQLQLMIQSMLEDRFQLKAHKETRELPIYNLVVIKEGKIKASEDQTPPNFGGGGPPLPCAPASATPAATPPPPPPPGPPGQRGLLDPNYAMPRGAMSMFFGPQGFGIRGSAVPITNLIGAIQQQIGRPVIDKTGLKGLFDFILQFSPEGLATPGLPGLPPPVSTTPGAAAGAGPAPAVAADPVPSLFTAIQELGLR